ncbi:MAG: adenylosuccinate synthase [Acidobacteria bacterium]|nr:adenylosuccinate synthase [Acidobacteriota bacterium]
MANLVVLGIQWGDEGKGKIVDLIADKFDYVARSTGGHNAGHTVRIGDKKFVLSLIPSGLMRGKKGVIGNGVVIDPAALLKEIEMLEGLGVAVKQNLYVSHRAHVIFPYHRMMERASEASDGKVKIGTTSRGIGPSYEDKIARRGIRIAELLDRETFPARFRAIAEEKNTIATALGIHEPWNIDQILVEYQDYAEKLRPYVADTIELLNRSIRSGSKVLFEGAQGTMLDIDHGSYPFVTSSNATAGGVCTGSGVSPRHIDGVIGIAKAYATRVGGGGFATELHGPEGDELRKAGFEFGTVTGRPRRCGWFDIPLARYASAINALSSLVVTKLDVLDYLETIPVCVGYRYKGELLEGMPALAEVYEAVEPVYEERPGWATKTAGITEFDALPQKAKDYLAYLEDKLEVEIGCISTGPERDETIVREGSEFQRLTA